MMSRRTPRSAQRAIGMPRVAYKIANATPDRNPSAVSDGWNSCLIGSSRMFRMLRSMKLTT